MWEVNRTNRKRRCPVNSNAPRLIVVGYDESEAARAALRWAADQADALEPAPRGLCLILSNRTLDGISADQS